MIYLFNSAYKPDYLQNIYRLIGTPVGCRQEMRYSVGQNTPPKKTDTEYKGRKCVICYVDRFGEGGYRFYPIRKGSITKVNRVHGRVYYEIALGDHCYSPDPAELTRQLNLGVDNCPTLTNNDPECGTDGLYCTEGPDLDDLISSSEWSWSSAVDQILNTRCFSEDKPAFFLTEITRDGKSPEHDRYGLVLRANKNYRVTVYFRTRNATSSSKRHINVRIGQSNLRDWLVGSNDNREHFDFSPLPIDFATSAISVRTSIQSPDSTGGDFEYSVDIPFRTESWRISALLLAILYAFTYLNQAVQPGMELFAWKTVGFAALNFMPFAIIVFALHTFRGRLNLSGF